MTGKQLRVSRSRNAAMCAEPFPCSAVERDRVKPGTTIAAQEPQHGRKNSGSCDHRSDASKRDIQTQARLSDKDTLFVEGDVDLIALTAAIAGAVAGGP